MLGCGDNLAPAVALDAAIVDGAVDATPAPAIRLLHPNGGEQFLYGAVPAAIQWQASGGGAASLSVDVELVSSLGERPLALGIAAVVGSHEWTVDGNVAGADYRVRVTVHAAGLPDASDESDQVFSIAGTGPVVSFAAQIQPIFDTRCTGSACHDATPSGALNLLSGVAHARLVNQPSAYCPAIDRVEPGRPDQSFLMWKLQGSGACFFGSRMPLGGAALDADELQLISDWIGNGAPNN
jgi:hypothetical protein